MFCNMHSILQYISVMRKKEVYMLRYLLLVGVRDKDIWSLLLQRGCGTTFCPGPAPSRHRTSRGWAPSWPRSASKSTFLEKPDYIQCFRIHLYPHHMQCVAQDRPGFSRKEPFYSNYSRNLFFFSCLC